jgi:transcriptional regulator
VFDLDFGRVMSEGGGVIGSSAMAIKRALSIGATSQRRKRALAGASILLPHFAVHLWTFQWKKRILFAMSKGRNTEAQKSEVLPGKLDLMALKVLDALWPPPGCGIGRRIEQVSEQVLQLNEGTVYTSLLRLQQRKWIASDLGTSENNRKAKYYSITKSGRKQLAREAENWERIAGAPGAC